MAQTVKHLPAMRETWVRSLGQEVPLRRKWQPTPELLHRKPHGQRSLVGYSPWSCKESDTTEWLHFLSLWAWVEVYQFFYLTEKVFVSLIFSIIYLVSILFPFWSLWFSSFCWRWTLLVLFLIPLVFKLGCLLETFLVS